MPITIVVWSILCLIWGSTWIVIKIGLNDLPPIGFATIRFLLATAILFAVVRIQKLPLPKSAREWRLLAIAGVLQFSVNYGLIFWSEQYITSGLAAVLQATLSVFGLLLAWIFLPDEKITATKILAVVIGVVGVVVIFADQLLVQNAMAFFGSVGMIVSAYSAAQAAILVKARGGAMHPVVLTFGQMLCGLPLIMAYMLAFEGNPIQYHWTWQAVAAVFYLAIIGTVAAFWLYYWLLSKVESNKAMTISIVTPLIAVLIGWIFLDERLPPQTLVGGLLIISSLALNVFRRSA